MSSMQERIEQYEEFMGEFSTPEMRHHLLSIGFFEAPASTKYHGNYEGGLFDHSFRVAKELVLMTEKLGLEWSNPRSPYIVGMFHDLCKCDAYEATSEGYKHNNTSLPGHGEKSIMVLAQMMQLTEEEVYCIRYHMGAYETDEWDYYGRAITKYPNVLATHTADMVASKVYGV